MGRNRQNRQTRQAHTPTPSGTPPLCIILKKSYSKVTFGVPAKVTQKLLKSDRFVSFVSLFWVPFGSLWPGPRKSLLSHLLCVFEFFGVAGSVGVLPGSQRQPTTCSSCSYTIGRSALPHLMLMEVDNGGLSEGD